VVRVDTADDGPPEVPIVKFIAIDASASDVFTFLSDARNWPRWATVNILGVGAFDDGWWAISTPNGPARIRLRTDESSGVVDHDFADGDGVVATLPARITPNRRGSTFALTFGRPGDVPEDDFAEFLATVDVELETLRRVLEGDES
jgi:hypothetical protein